MRLQAKGYLTVFLSLSITIILSLILALYQGARIGAMKMRTECVSDIAMNSVLAEYHRELQKKYDLLLVDTSYGGASPSIANTEEHLRYYVQGNFDRTPEGLLFGAVRLTGMECREAKIPAYSLATDGNGAVLQRQILAYMTAEPAEGLLSRISGNVGELKSHGYDSRDIEAENEENQQQIREIREAAANREKDKGETETEQEAQENPADLVATQKSAGILSLAIPDQAGISTASVQLSQYASHRQNMTGTGLDETETLSLTDRVLLDQYMFEKCGSYTDIREGTPLKYELEYILEGEGSDRENLEKVARKLMFWREASNFSYLITDTEKCKKAEAVAMLLSAVTGLPELEEPVKYSILFAWSFAESISDLRILFQNGRVPIVKTNDTWKTGFLEMADLRHAGGGSGDQGLNYEEYLRMLFFMEHMNTKTERLTDLMEMNIRETAGNQNFRLDACMDCFTGEIRTEGRNGFSMKIQRTYGYEQ